MLSRRAKELFGDYYINSVSFFDVSIYNKKGLVANEYFLMYCPYLGYDAINFAKSTFRVNSGLPATPKWEHYSFDSLEQYNLFKSISRKSIEFESMVMSDKFDLNLDFFECRIGPMFMSERLIKALKEEGLTGVFFPSETGSWAYAD